MGTPVLPMQAWAVFLPPLAVILISLAAGLWVRAVVIPRLARMAQRTKWDVDDIVIKSVRGSVLPWSLIAGAYIAVQMVPMPERIADVTGHLLKAAWIFSGAWVAAHIASEVIVHYGGRWQMAVTATSLAQQAAKIGILGLGMLIILDSLGIKIGSLLAALGIGSLAVALGLQDTLSNLFAGMYAGVSKNLRIGDYIKLQSGEEGYITDIGWRETRIRALPDNLIVVPNTKLGQSILTNYYLPGKELAVPVEAGVDYGSDLGQVERVTSEVGREVMREVAGGVPAFEPFIRYHTFGESSVNFTVILRAKEFTDQYLIKHEFIKRLHARYQQEGIRIPFPVRTVHLISSDTAATR